MKMNLAQKIERSWVAILVLAALAGLCGCHTRASEPVTLGQAVVDAGAGDAAAPSVQAGRVGQQDDYAPRGAGYFPSSVLTNELGEKKAFFDLIAGKIVVVNFVYTTCGDSCPLETARLRKVADRLGDRLGKDVHFISISIDPENDTPATLAAYKERFHLPANWHFWVGQPGQAEEIQKKLGVYREAVDQKKDHSLDMAVGNQATGQWLKRSHLENAEVMINLLDRLNPRKPQRAQIVGYDHAPSRIADADGVERLYVSRCMDCHTIGRGDGIGPDLKDVTSRRPRAWLKRWIKEPDAMLKEHDPIAMGLYEKYMQVAMPNTKLEDADVELLIDFIDRESKSQAQLGQAERLP